MTEKLLFDGATAEALKTPKAPRVGESRMLKPNRVQVEWRCVAPDGLIAADHVARAVVAFVDRLDLSPLREAIQAKKGQPGRPAIDPGLLFGLWVYATCDGVTSARELARLCNDHDAFRWICGGVEVHAHTLADFRSGHRREFDGLLTSTVALLIREGLVDLERAAQDGMRVRASAGTASFRRRKTLEESLAEAEAHIAVLRALEDDASATKRSRGAKLRAAEQRKERIEEALRQLPAIEALKAKNRRKGDDPEKSPGRASTTDPDARFMKMPDGGIRPAFNVQFETDTKSQIVLGVSVTNDGTDRAQLQPMVEQVQQRYGHPPNEQLVDGGFVNGEHFDAATQAGVTVYAPVQKPRDPTRDPYAPVARDSPAVAEWRARMKTDAAKEVYKDRASTAECVNADARRNKGLMQFPVRGIEKVTSVALLVAIAHDVLRAIGLGLT